MCGPWCAYCPGTTKRRIREAVIKSAASAASPEGFQAVIKLAASAASPAVQKIMKKIKEKLPFWTLYIGIPICSYDLMGRMMQDHLGKAAASCR